MVAKVMRAMRTPSGRRFQLRLAIVCGTELRLHSFVGFPPVHYGAYFEICWEARLALSRTPEARIHDSRNGGGETAIGAPMFCRWIGSQQWRQCRLSTSGGSVGLERRNTFGEEVHRTTRTGPDAELLDPALSADYLAQRCAAKSGYAESI